MITEYFVCYGSSTAKLQESVNEAIKNGWQPLGGVAVFVREWLCSEVAGQNRTDVYGGEEVLCQAVAR